MNVAVGISGTIHHQRLSSGSIGELYLVKLTHDLKPQHWYFFRLTTNITDNFKQDLYIHVVVTILSKKRATN